MSEPTRETIFLATRAFLDQMRREFIRRNPNSDPTGLMWDNLSLEDRSVVLRSIKAAFAAVQPENIARLRQNEE